MSREIIRAIPLYVQGKKFAEVTSGSYDIHANAERAFGCVEGYLGHLQGWLSAEIRPRFITPVRGIAMPLSGYIFDGAIIQLGLPVDGTVHTFEGVVQTLGFQWDFRTGACTGEVLFEGGRPEFPLGG